MYCGERTQHEKLESRLSSLEQARRSFTDIRSRLETSRRLRRRRLVTLCLYAYCPSGKIAQCAWDAREVGDSISLVSRLFFLTSEDESSKSALTTSPQ